MSPRHPASLATAVLAGLLAALLLFATPASASRIIECGNHGWRQSTGKVGWGMSGIDGAGLFNLTTRKVPCRRARPFARRYFNGHTPYHTWTCTEVKRYEWQDTRCTASRGRVIRWQFAA